mmetsp:Transcript_12795/g.29799  ORF Transcript_12795/g.29799 Transcript_12795/m.29799 type:complete len:889 (+) Transcript_12795:1-2667(+)
MFYSEDPQDIKQAIGIGIATSLVVHPITFLFHWLFAQIRRREALARHKLAVEQAIVTKYARRRSSLLVSDDKAAPPKRASPRVAPAETIVSEQHVEPTVPATPDNQSSELPQWVHGMANVMAARQAGRAWRTKAMKNAGKNRKHAAPIAPPTRPKLTLKEEAFDRLDRLQMKNERHAIDALKPGGEAETKLNSRLNVVVHTIAMGTIGFVVYMNMLYAINFPERVAQAWLLSSSVSTLNSIFVLDPINISLAGAITIVASRWVAKYRKLRRESALEAEKAAPLPDEGAVILEDDTPLTVVDDLIDDAAFLHTSATNYPLRVTHAHYTHAPNFATDGGESSWAVTHAAVVSPRIESSTSLEPMVPGLLHYLASRGGTDSEPLVAPLEWRLRSSSGATSSELSQLVLSSTGVAEGESPRIIPGTREHPAWIALDFGPGNFWLPRSYCLRHGGRSLDDALSHWRLEGCTDGVSWKKLDEHSGEAPFGRGGGRQSWNIDVNNPIRHVRLVLTGRNLSGRFDLCLAGLELYGSIYSVKSALPVPHPLWWSRHYQPEADMVGQSMWDWVSVVGEPSLPVGPTAELNGRLRIVSIKNMSQPGIFEWLGTMGHSAPQANPETTGMIRLWGTEAMETLGKPSDVFTPDGGCLLTARDQHAKVAVDFGDGVGAVVQGYSLRHPTALGKNNVLTSWSLEASDDGTQWVQLRNHHNDLNVRAGVNFGLHGFAARSSVCRHLRIRMTEPNSSSAYRLALGQFECHGAIVLAHDSKHDTAGIASPLAKQTSPVKKHGVLTSDLANQFHQSFGNSVQVVSVTAARDNELEDIEEETAPIKALAARNYRASPRRPTALVSGAVEDSEAVDQEGAADLRSAFADYISSALQGTSVEVSVVEFEES